MKNLFTWKRAGSILSAVGGLGIFLILGLQTKRTDRIRKAFRRFTGIDDLKDELNEIREILIMANEQDVKLGQELDKLKDAIGSLTERISAELQKVADEVRAQAPQIADDIEKVQSLAEQVNSILAGEAEEPTDPTDPSEEEPVDEDPVDPADEDPVDGEDPDEDE